MRSVVLFDLVLVKTKQAKSTWRTDKNLKLTRAHAHPLEHLLFQNRTAKQSQEWLKHALPLRGIAICSKTTCLPNERCLGRERDILRRTDRIGRPHTCCGYTKNAAPSPKQSEGYLGK